MTRILIADDHAVVRRGLKEILEEEYPKVHLGEAKNSQEVLEAIHTQKWDILILDINMPDRSGIDILGELKTSHPKLPVLILSMHPEEQFAIRVLKAGARGYLTKASAPDELIRAVQKILDGGKYISPALSDRLLEEIGTEPTKPKHELLSDREFEVLCLIGSGKTVSEIANQLSLSVKTISTYRARILDKMKMKTNAELISYVIHNKLVE